MDAGFDIALTGQAFLFPPMFRSSPESFHLALVAQCVLPRMLRSCATTPLKRSPAAWRVAMNTGSSKNVGINSLMSPQLFDPTVNPTIYLAISKIYIFSFCFSEK